MILNPEPGHRRRIVEYFLILWIAGTALFFFLRFSAAFYYANAAAVNELTGRLGL